MFKTPRVAPRDALEKERRGPVVGTFCLGCGAVYPLHAAAHRGKPRYGKDHVATPCLHEGQAFAPGAQWWQPAVEVLPASESAAD